MRVDRDYLKIKLVAKFQKAIVRTHARMFAACFERDAELLAHILSAFCQGARRNDYVIDGSPQHEVV
jgi:hypothetical protein